jgi:diguanylate cyclase (GGDEF)-like protein/PAS domain S-box-containing protein
MVGQAALRIRNVEIDDCHAIDSADASREAMRREIARLRQALAERADDRLSLQILIDQMPDRLYVKDAASRFIVANRAVATDNGFAETAELVGRTDFDLHPFDQARRFFEIEQTMMRTGQPIVDFEETFIDDAGARVCMSTTKVPFRNFSNQIVGMVGIGRDVTLRKQGEELRDEQARIIEMIAKNERLGAVLDRLVRLIESQLSGICGSILLLDADGLRLRHGAAPSLPRAYLEAIDGVCIDANVGSCPSAAFRREPVIVVDIMGDPLWRDFRDLAAAHGLRSCWSTPILSHDGAVLGTFAMYSTDVRAPTAAEIGLVEVATRIAAIAIERRRAEDRIHFMANHDALTGLPNRALLTDRLAQAMTEAARLDLWATVAFVDLDNFKFVNDSLGHNAGDELLKAIAARMVAGVRPVDTVVRLGGDEFVILLCGQPKDLETVSARLKTIREAIAAPIRIRGQDVQVTCSVGMANYPDDGADADTLLANADAAMYRAKEIGRDNFQIYAPELNEQAHEKFLLLNDLRNAIARSEFVLHYQPQVDLRTGRIVAVEALIRWRHPTLGMVSPMRFIPLAEETGLIAPIGDWVLGAACRQNKLWQDAGLPPMAVGVNVSARQFKERNWICRVAATLAETGMEARYLELELTESVVMQDARQAVATMKALQKLGVRLSVDDFGTGYSSLSALKSFPVERLKIDKSFIDDIVSDGNDRAVVAAVISLGQKLGLRVIAEGVETAEQLAFLRDNNCDEMQGYLFSKPLPAEELEALLAASPRA